MDIKTFIEDFAEKAKNLIAELEYIKGLTGAQKKQRLDEKMTKWAEELLNTSKINIILKQAIKQFIIKNIPAITQAVFDLIKTRINGITK